MITQTNEHDGYTSLWQHEATGAYYVTGETSHLFPPVVHVGAGPLDVFAANAAIFNGWTGDAATHTQVCARPGFVQIDLDDH